MKTPQVPAIPGMTPLGITPRRADGTIMSKPKPPKPPRKPARKPKPHKFPKASFAPSMVPEAALAREGASPLHGLSMLSRELLQRNPYIMAQRLFVAGHLLSGQAAALACTDGDFIGECFYQHKNAREEAARIVRDVWSAELVANVQSQKRCARLFGQAGGR